MRQPSEIILPSGDTLALVLEKHKLWLEGKAEGQRADLTDADLTDADLTEANLTRADLTEVDLSWASLTETNLTRANLTRADLTSANIPVNWLPLQNSPEGEFIAWKKLKNSIAKLRIPANARRVNSTERKCRAEFADVLALFPLDVKKGVELVEDVDCHTEKLTYKVGKRVFPDTFSDDVRVTCAPGIHYFITRREAEEY